MKELLAQYRKSREEIYKYFNYTPNEYELLEFDNLPPHIEDCTDHYWNTVCNYVILFSSNIEDFRDFMSHPRKHSSENLGRIIERPDFSLVVIWPTLAIFRTENRLNMAVDRCVEGQCDDPNCPKSMESWYYHMMKQFSKK